VNIVVFALVNELKNPGNNRRPAQIMSGDIHFITRVGLQRLVAFKVGKLQALGESSLPGEDLQDHFS